MSGYSVAERPDRLVSSERLHESGVVLSGDQGEVGHGDGKDLVGFEGAHAAERGGELAGFRVEVADDGEVAGVGFLVRF